MLKAHQVFERKLMEAGLYGYFDGFRLTPAGYREVGRLWRESQEITRQVRTKGLP